MLRRNKRVTRTGLVILCLWLGVCFRLYSVEISTVTSSKHQPDSNSTDQDQLNRGNLISHELSGPYQKQKPWRDADNVRSSKDSVEVAKYGTVSYHAQTPDLNELGRDAFLGMILSDADAEAFRENDKHDFNVFLSNRMGLHRDLPDVRPPGCSAKNFPRLNLRATIVICFHNEALSALLRTVESVVSRSPVSLIEEFLLVDDASQLEDLSDALSLGLSNVTKIARIVRLEERHGLIRARIKGAREAKGDVVIFMDSHCEVNQNWLEPLLEEVRQDRTTIACPVIDMIHANTLEYTASPVVRGGFNWGLHFRWDSLPAEALTNTEPYSSPAMAGGIFAIEKNRFIEMGEYDEAMEIWGGENIELSLRTWMCGGRIKIVPCSRVGHIFRSRRPYGNDGKGDTHFINSIRVAHVWLDESIEKFYEARPEARKMDPGDISKRLAVRKSLKCHSFQWFLENIYPEAKEKSAFSREDASVTRYNHKFNLRHMASGLCLKSESLKNHPVGLVQCDKVKRQRLYGSDGSSKAIVLAKRLCLDSDCLSGGPNAVCAAKCHFTGGSQAWIYSKTENSTLLLNLFKGLCLAFRENTLELARCNLNPQLLRWRVQQ